MTPFVKIFVKLLSIVAIASGIAGFFVDNLLGVEMSIERNIAHILIGIIGFQMSSTYGKARTFLLIFGLLFAVLAIVGLITGSAFGYYSLDMNDNYLHIAISALCLIVGLGSKKKN